MWTASSPFKPLPQGQPSSLSPSPSQWPSPFSLWPSVALPDNNPMAPSHPWMYVDSSQPDHPIVWGQTQPSQCVPAMAWPLPSQPSPANNNNNNDMKGQWPGNRHIYVTQCRQMGNSLEEQADRHSPRDQEGGGTSSALLLSLTLSSGGRLCSGGGWRRHLYISQVGDSTEFSSLLSGVPHLLLYTPLLFSYSSRLLSAMNHVLIARVSPIARPYVLSNNVCGMASSKDQ